MKYQAVNINVAYKSILIKKAILLCASLSFPICCIMAEYIDWQCFTNS